MVGGLVFQKQKCRGQSFFTFMDPNSLLNQECGNKEVLTSTVSHQPRGGYLQKALQNKELPFKFQTGPSLATTINTGALQQSSSRQNIKSHPKLRGLSQGWCYVHLGRSFLRRRSPNQLPKNDVILLRVWTELCQYLVGIWWPVDSKSLAW